jgi:predicted Zn-dependent peptidase
MNVADVEQWPDRLKRVTVADLHHAARKYLVDKNSVTGYLLPTPDFTSSVTEQPANAPKGKS